ncbi:hypothetical protein RJT34_13510 [Clitoria ternatea]|uniref:PB1 domain-containing protein n=1 Tax=Clitoria ternatea TaxID=43366 RepID=A0AAN9JP41_CLITE
MENYSYQSYPDSGESSPRSREIEFDNPPPWDEQQQQQQNYKAKFMCSYGGKIHPRSHDNQLSYVGGETKILAVDRTIKFPAMLSKLSTLCDAPPQDLSFKYQLPGEDLDALISVTNDDDLDHMMHEYDRLYRASARPARMRLFLFLSDNLPSGPASAPPDPTKPNNVDFLFGLDKTIGAPPPAAVKLHDTVPEPVAPPPEYLSRLNPNINPNPNLVDRVMVLDPNINQIQRDLKGLQIAENEQGGHRRKSEDGVVGNYTAGDYYVQKLPEKFPPTSFPASSPPPPPPQAGYWPEKHVSGEVYPAASGGGDQPVYMIPAPGTFYHAPVGRPPVSQGYYTVQRMASDGYREPPMYGGVAPGKPPFSSTVPANLAAAQPVKAVPAYTEGFSVVRPSGIPDNSTGAPYAQVAYDSASGRQIYYTAPGGVVHAPPYQGVAPPVTADMRPVGVSLGHDVKVISKVTQGSL